MKYIKYILSAAVCLSAAAGLTAEDKAFNEARIYVNPGHGGWGSGDRNLVTINHALGDTTGFYETNTNLRKGLQLYHDLVDNGAAEVMLSRTVNGIDDDCVKDGVPQIVNLSAICEDVEANNIDYFISIHSNAATEGAATNYPLVLYRGTDDAVGNGLVDAKNMGLAAWPYINNNGITYKSHYTGEDDSNVRGDISFMGGSLTTMGYTGYYGVLRHGADGYLIEGCFHTYHPERHRLLNVDYCRQEGMRYARAIRAWFNGPTETTGDIMGTVKNALHPLENNLYSYKAASMDAYAPLNEFTVKLMKDGQEIATYTTDKEYNGVFVFEKLAPGKYTLDFTASPDWHPYTEEIEVVANTTVFTNVRLTDINEELPDPDAPEPEVEYYTHPEQDGDIAAGNSYEFTPGETVDIQGLEGLTVRRAILRDGKYYVLAHDAERTPHLMVVNPEDGTSKEMSLEGLVTEGFNGKNMSWTLSDIAFTNDGVLVGTNSVVIGRENNAYCNGDFYMYAWKGDDTTPLEDAKPTIVTTLPTNTSNSLAQAGNNYSNLIANSIAINGNFDEFSFYFDSHAGDAWNTNYGLRHVVWTMKDGTMTNYEAVDANAEYDETMFGEDAMMTLSPLGLNRIIFDGSQISTKEFEISLAEGVSIEHPGLNDDEVAVEAAGSNYFRYADDIFMATPTFNADDNSYGVNLYNITDGLDKAEKLAQVDNLLSTEGRQPMNAFGVVRNADIDLYLMAGNKIAKVTTEGITQSSEFARIFAYNLKTEKDGEDAYTLSFNTIIPATEASVNLINTHTGEVELTIPATGADCEYTATVQKSDVAENTNYTWEAAVKAGNVTSFKEIDVQQLFTSPYGIAVNNNPANVYFGNVYVSNTTEGETPRGNVDVGIYEYSPNGDNISSSDVSAGIEWTGVAGQGPRRIAVAADGRIFASDYSTENAGIYVIDPDTWTGTPLFKDAVNDGNGSLTVNGTYVGGRMVAVGVRGEGESTQLYAADATASGASWKKFVNRYDIGTASEWSTAPSYSAAASSYIGNENSSIVPVSTGFWAAQFRGQGSSSVANPCLFYFSDEQGDAVYDTSEIDDKESSNGALAVDEKTGTVAHSFGGGVRVFHYRLNYEGIPQVELLFEKPLDQTPLNSFAFDYAGNLYVVSGDGKIGFYGMPTNDNSITVPAKDQIVFGFDSVEEIESTAKASVYPNPASDVATVTAGCPIERIAIYNAASGAEALNVAGNGQNEMTIDVAGLSKGVYIVRINNVHTLKLIKR